MATRTSIYSDPRSGGKMVRPRRLAGRRTPYDRPPPSASPSLRSFGPPEQNPNWLSRLILSPTRLIASGAGKVLASVFGPDSDSSSDSGDSCSEEDMDDVNDDDGDNVSAEGVDRVDKENQTSQITNSLTKDPQVFEWKSETKRVIAKLLSQETFSREECERLTKIITSRVVDPSISGAVGSDVDVPDLHSTAVLEAKKWLEEKKSGSGSKSNLEHGTCTLNTAMLPHVSEADMGSPVDLAKSYMQARPPWLSPSVKHIQYNSPTLAGSQLLKEESPYALSGNSSKLPRDSPASGSWSILEELRKVRSKATEELLRTRPSSAIDWSSLASDYKRIPDLSIVDEVAASPNVTNDGGREALLPNPDTSIPGNTQDLELIQISEERGELNFEQRLKSLEDVMAVMQSDADACGLRDNGENSHHPLSAPIERTVQDSRLQEINGSALNDAIEMGSEVAANGFPSGSSLFAGEGGAKKSRPTDEEHNIVGLGDEEKTRGASVEETCKLLSEDLLEVPVINQNDSVASGSQNSSSTHPEPEEISSQDQIRQNSKRGLVGRPSDVAEKQRGRKVSRYNKRGRGRGK